MTHDISLKIKNISVGSDAHGLIYILFDTGSILLLSLCGSMFCKMDGVLPTLGVVVVIVLIGNRTSALESCVHQAAHFTLFRTRWLNDSLEFIFALPILEDVKSYRQIHRIHHEHFGKEDDPTRVMYMETGVENSPDRLLWIVLIRPLLGYNTCRFVGEKIKLAIVSRRFRYRYILFIALAAFLIYTCGLGVHFLLFYLIPVFFVLPVLLFWSEIIDHLGLYRQNGFGFARNLTFGPMAWFLYPHSEGYHLVHHLFPGVPSFRLADAHNILRENKQYKHEQKEIRGTLELYRSLSTSQLQDGRQRFPYGD